MVIILNDTDWRSNYTKQIDYSIGHGSFGKVYLVCSNSNQKYYAMKKIDLNQPILKTSPINQSYVLQEGLKLYQLNLNHQNLIKYYACYNFNHNLYWIMEYCDGGTLKNKINLYLNHKKHLSQGLIWHFIIQILHAIRYIHSKGIVHRDLKPENILIQNKRGVCKLGDFSFSKIISQFETTDENNEDEYQVISDHYINISQVGTPSYMPPELRTLIESQMDYSSLETFNQKLKVCQKNIFKSDIFSFGCILFELATLKLAFENRFHLDEDEFNKIDEKIDKEIINNFHEFNKLMKFCLKRDSEMRFNIEQIFELEEIKTKLVQNFEPFYYEQIIPGILLDNLKINSFTCFKEKLIDSLKPVSMKCLKFKNLIFVLANSKSNESFLLVFNEFSQYLKEIKFNFKSFDFCFDERYSHFYISSQIGDIFRYNIDYTSHFDIQLDGVLNLKDEIENKFIPHHLVIIESEFYENNTRKLVFNDINSNQLISVQVNLKINHVSDSIACYLNRGLTLDNLIKQILYTNQDLICLFDSSDKINIYDLKTFQYKRSNNNNLTELNSYKSMTCFCMDSSYSIYSSDGRSIFKLENETLKKCKKITPSLKSSDKNKSLSHSIGWMSLMANGALVLLTDSIQMESANLYVLKEVLK